MTDKVSHSRRGLLKGLAASGAVGVGTAFGVSGGLKPPPLLAKPEAPITLKPITLKPIPSSGEKLPVIGMGSWITFNVGDDRALRDQRSKVLAAFFEGGGAMVDSSPMYGSSEEVIGYMLNKLSRPKGLFATTKIWTPFPDQGAKQVSNGLKLWGVPRFDLLQVHNLVAWQAHLKLIHRLKAEGLVRYVGITTSHGRRHEDFEAVMKSEPLDFVQLTYNIENRAVEERLLPLAADRGIAVIANRPFGRGTVIDRYSQHPLPDFAKEIDCANWAQFLLKFIVSHPALTVAIPATSRVDHALENMGALRGGMPDAAMRAEMAAYCQRLRG